MSGTVFTFKGVLVRHWCPRDREAAATIVRVCLEEYGLSFEREGADRDAVCVEECYSGIGEFWVVMDDNGRMVGTAGYYEIEGKGAVEIRKMYLLKEARGKGLGRKLLEALEQRITEKGYSVIYIETASVLTEACKLYHSAGYQCVGGVETARCDQKLFKTITRESPTEEVTH